MDFGFKTEYNGRLKKISSGTSQLNKNLITRRERGRERQKRKKNYEGQFGRIIRNRHDMWFIYIQHTGARFYGCNGGVKSGLLRSL